MIELAQVRHPAAPRSNPRRLRTGALGWYRELRDEFPEYHPLPIWPEPGGFLPFASSIDGDSIGWLTDGEPDRWPLIVEPRHHEQGPPAIPCSTRSSDSVPTEIRMNRSHDSPVPDTWHDADSIVPQQFGGELGGRQGGVAERGEQVYLAEHFEQLLDITRPQIQRTVRLRNAVGERLAAGAVCTLPGSATFYLYDRMVGAQVTRCWLIFNTWSITRRWANR